MRERTLYALLAIVFAVSRLGYYLLGVRFDARPVLHYYQFVDPELLKHRLVESLFYLHIQPPGWNLYIGAVLKFFPRPMPRPSISFTCCLGWRFVGQSTT